MMSPSTLYAQNHSCMKRKIDGFEDQEDDDPDEDTSIKAPPAKVTATEERVVAKFDGMHIGTRRYHGFQMVGEHQDARGVDEVDFEADNSSRDFDDIEPRGSSDNRTDDEKEEERRIVVSDELERALKWQDVVQKLAQDEMNRACKAIVLWQPPAGTLPSELQKIRASSSPDQPGVDAELMSDETDDLNNNNNIQSEGVSNSSRNSGSSPFPLPAGPQVDEDTMDLEL